MSRVFKSEAAAELVHEKYRRLLSSWPVKNEQLRIPTRLGETFVVACGPAHAPPVILLHGTMATSATWLREMSVLQSSFRVYAIDVIGDAGFSAPVRPKMDSDAHASWLIDVLSELEIKKASFVGLSLGGWIALDFSIRYSELVDKLVLLTPGGIADKNVLIWAMPLLLLGPWGARKVSERIIGCLPKIESAQARELGALSAAIFNGMRPRTEKPPTVTDEQLRSLEMSVFVLLGENDVTMDAQAIKERIDKNVQHSIVCIVPGRRHFLGDQTRSICEFLTRPSIDLPGVGSAH